MEIKGMTTSTFWKGELGVKGTVKEQEKEYKVSLYVKGSQVNDYSCSCMTGDSYKGMCRHCKALFAQYEKQVAEGNRKIVTTSLGVRTMIREYTNREVDELVRSGEEETVKLSPKLIYKHQMLSIEFKVGRERFYVLQDLVAFAKAIEQGAYVEYGKSLAFHHNRSVFSEESRPLVDFILELVNLYSEHFTQFQKGNFSMVPSLRELNLGRGNRDRFFNLMMNHTIPLEGVRGVKHSVLICKKNPEPEIRVKRIGRNGIRVSIDKAWYGFSGEQHFYVGNHEKLYQCDADCSKTISVFFEQMIPSYGTTHEVEISEKDIPLFYQRVLCKIGTYGVIDSPEVVLDSYKPEELKAKFEFDSENGREISMKPTLCYGDFSFQPIEDEKVPRTVCRDVPGEFKISQVISKYFKYREHETDNLLIRDDEDAMYHLLLEGMGEFAKLGEVYVSDSLKHLKVTQSPKISVGVSVNGNWLDLTVDSGDMSGLELGRILTAYTQKKKYYRLKGGGFLNLEDDGLTSVARLIEGFGISKTELQNKNFRLPKYRALYVDHIFKQGNNLSLYRDQLFKAVVRGMKAVEDSDYEIPKELQPILRGYQKVGYRWLRTLDYYGFGGILADDMGLGKTIQVITVLLEERMQKKEEALPSLIICPASLVYNWENEIHTFAPSLRVLTVTGNVAEREERISRIAEYDAVVTSYDLLKRDVDAYLKTEFRFEIIDEAQYIKNAATQSAKAVKSIRAQTKFAMTGTPIENRLGELWSLFDYLMPGFLFSYQHFRKEYEVPIAKEQDKEKLSNLHYMIAPFILRRLKKDVLKELPDKLETIIYSKFGKDQKELYAANALLLKQQLEKESAGEYRSGKLQILAELTKLRQICCDPKLYYSNYHGDSAKLETCIELLSNGVEGGHKILLFSQFTSMLDLIGERLKKENVPYYKLTGSTSKEERLKLVTMFHKDEVPVFLISLKAGGTGLNLTAADIVIHYDPWWNVAAQNQATDRTHRIGQNKQVSVFKLITKNTIEENILKLQESKQNLAEQIITEGTVSLSSLTKDDLLKLLSEGGN